MWHHLIRPARSRSRTSRPGIRFKPRPSLEALEDRWLPSTFTWFSNVDGNFNDASKWHDQNNNPGVPGPGDTANINYGGINVTVTANASVNILNDNAHLIVNSGQSLAVSAASVLNGMLDNNGTVNVTAGTLSVRDGGSSSGTFNTAAGAGLYFTGGYTWNAGTAFTGTGLLDVYGTVTNAAPLSLASLEVDYGADVVDNGGLTITGNLNWTGGTIGGYGATTQLAATATTTFNSTGNVEVDTGHTLQNAGTVNWIAGDLDLHDTNTTLVNLAGGTFNAACDNTLTHSGTFSNAGTFTKTSPVGTGTTLDQGVFNNTGTVNVQSGSLSPRGGGTASGAFSVNASGSLTFYTIPYTCNAGASFSGNGLVYIGDTFYVNAPLSIATLQVDAYNPYYNGDVVDNGNLTVTGSLNWTGGTIGGTGVTTLAAGSTSTINTGDGVYLDTGHTLQNAGTLNWAAAQINFNSTTSSLVNMAGATFNVQCDNAWSGGGTVSNAGTLNKTSPTGSGFTNTVRDAVFNNTGTVNIQSGGLGFFYGGTDAGTFTIAAGSALDLGYLTYTLNSGASFSGAGAPDVTSGTVTVNGNVSAANFELDGGTLSGTGNLTTTGTFAWTGGAINDVNGHFTMPAGSTLNIEGNTDKSFTGGTMNLSGTTNWTDSGNLSFSGGATISNKGGAVFNIQNDQSMTGSGTFSNAGLLTKVGGMATTTLGITLNNGGRVEVHTNTLSVTGSVAQVSGTTLTGGTWSVFGSSSVFSTLSFASAPALTALGAAAKVTLNGLNTTFSNLSALASNAGSFSVLGGQTFTTAGSFTDTGTLTVGPSSTLAVNGSFTLAAAGTLAIQMAGTNTKPTIGRVTVAAGGTMTLAGTLSLTSKVKPAVGASFTIGLNNGSSPVSGTFAGMPEGSTVVVNGCTYRISYAGGDGNDVTLTRVS